MRTITRAAVVTVIVVGCVGCDQASKAIVRARVPVGQGYAYFDGAIRIQHAENVGAFLSVGESLPRETRDLALAAIAAGGMGNLVDRLFHAGSVTDFLYIGVGRLHTGIFNIADLTLSLALAVLLLEQPLLSAVSSARHDRSTWR
jgi:signal peptidase II